jgi:hypothetical protein
VIRRSPAPLNPRSAPISILDAIDSPEIWGGWFKHPQTWAPWSTFLSVLFGLPLDEANLELFRRCTGRRDVPSASGTPRLGSFVADALASRSSCQ